MSLIPYFSQQLYFYVSTLDEGQLLKLEETVCDLAQIDDDQLHMFDDLDRLVRAIVVMKKPFWQRTALAPGHADLIAAQYPFIEDGEWEQRMLCVSSWGSLKNRFFEKYPSLHCEQKERAFKAQELFFLTFPEPLNLEPTQAIVAVIEELIAADHDIVTAEIILDRLLARTSFHPTSTDIAHAIRLKALERTARENIYSSQLQKAWTSVFNDVFFLSSSEGDGKFKPLSKAVALKETYGSKLDRIFGFGMTAPTRLFQAANFTQHLEEARALFLSASGAFKQNNIEEAKQLKARAFEKFDSLLIPAAVRNAIFGEMYALYGKEQKIDRLGEKLFYNGTAEWQKARVIQNYLDSDAFKQHAFRQGSVQTWIHHCGRAFDLIVKDPDGGSKLKTAPKALVHLYALLGILKGSMDCSSGNTFVDYDAALGRVVNFWDFDDEKSMPDHNNWWSFRLWQLGLPQCAEAFDRATLLLFADESLLEKVSDKAQLDRLTQQVQLFQEELKKDQIELTPRELFFRLFGGREHYDHVKWQFNKDGIRISPVELFEFHLPEIGRDHWYTGEENEKTLVGNNMKALYHPNPP